MVQPPPRDGEVRLRRDGQGWALVCAMPCGNDGRCLNRGEHPGLALLPKALQGVCWLGRAGTEDEGRWRAECNGWSVVP